MSEETVSVKLREFVEKLIQDGTTVDQIYGSALGMVAALSARSGITREDFLDRCGRVYDIAMKYTLSPDWDGSVN